jgi:hypothetical protein
MPEAKPRVAKCLCHQSFELCSNSIDFKFLQKYTPKNGVIFKKLVEFWSRLP